MQVVFIFGPGGTLADRVTGKDNTKIKAVIFNEPLLSAAEINVETFRGAVQLSGFVSSAADIKRAIEITQRVRGVSSVQNHIRVKN